MAPKTRQHLYADRYAPICCPKISRQEKHAHESSIRIQLRRLQYLASDILALWQRAARRQFYVRGVLGHRRRLLLPTLMRSVLKKWRHKAARDVCLNRARAANEAFVGAIYTAWRRPMRRFLDKIRLQRKYARRTLLGTCFYAWWRTQDAFRQRTFYEFGCPPSLFLPRRPNSVPPAKAAADSGKKATMPTLRSLTKNRSAAGQVVM